MATGRLRALLLAVVTVPLVVQSAEAHVIWFPPNQGGYKLWLSEFDEPLSESYDPAGLLNVTAYDRSKNIVPTSVLTQNTPITVIPNGNIAALTVSYDRGFWKRDDTQGMDVEHDPNNYLSYLTQNQQAAIGYNNIVHQLKYTEALYDWSDSFKQPFDLPLDIMPLTNPFNLKAGDQLPIEVLFQGQVVNNADVEYLNQPQNVNQQNITYIPIGPEGLQPIEVDYSTDATANSPLTYYATSLTVNSTSIPESSNGLGIAVFGGLVFALKRGKWLR